MTWLKYITINLGINIGLQYIRNMDECIPKLQLHQHSLLTRKVFSRHNLLALVFFSISTGSSCHLHLESSESSSHLCLQVIFILRIWIISRSGSSWDIITGFGSSLDLDQHHSIWIITWSGSSSLDWIYIITRSGSRYGSSLDLDHHYWILIITRSGSLGVIITRSGSSLNLYLLESS